MNAFGEIHSMNTISGLYSDYIDMYMYISQWLMLLADIIVLCCTRREYVEYKPE